MTTNILLIIIIVLLVVGLILQLFQLIAIMTLPNQFFESFFDGFGPDGDDVGIDIESEELVPEKITKGFTKARKSKQARWTVPNKTLEEPKKNQKHKSRTKGSSETTEPEIETVN